MPLDHDAFRHLELEAVGSGDGDQDEGGNADELSDGSSDMRLTTDVRTWRAEWILNGRVVVYTDGACRNNQHERLRRAGYGCFWGRGQARNISRPLVGAVQTN